MAQLAVGLAGAAAGNFLLPGIGGQIGWAVGAYVGGVLFGEKPEDTEGPRLSDLTVQSATEGAEMPMSWGAVRLPSTVIWADKKREIAIEQDAGGKGGSSPTHTSYTYTLNFAVSFGKAGDGAAAKLRRVWYNKKLIYDATSGANAVATNYSFKFYDGTQTTADPIIESVVGTGNAPAYKKQILIVGYAWNLTLESGNRLGQIEAEIVTNGSATSSIETILTTTTTHGSPDTLFYSSATDSLWATFGGNGGTNFAKVMEIDMQTKEVITESETDSNTSLNLMLFSPQYQLNNQTKGLLYKKNSGGADSSDIIDLKNNLEVLSSITHGGNDANFYKVCEAELNMYVGYILSGVGAKLVAFDKFDYSLTTITAPSGYDFIEDSGGVYIPNDGISFGTMIVPLERTSDSAIVWSTYDGSSFDTTNVSATRTTSNTTLLPHWVYADDGDVYIAANLTSGTTDPYLIRLNADGSEKEEINISADYSASSWPSASGTPHLHYSPEQRAIYFIGAENVHRFLIDTQDIEKWDTVTTLGSWCYFDAATSTVFSGYSASNTAKVYAIRIPIVSTAAYAVSDILDDLSEMVGVTTAMRDWTGVTETVLGFVHTKKTSSSSDMQPLLTYSLADAVSTGWKIKGVELGGSVADTIVTGTTIAGNSLKRIKPHDIRLPNLSQTQYVSSDSDMQPAMASHEWYTAPGNQTTQLSLPITLSDAEAAAFNQKFLQLSYNLQKFEFNLPPLYLALEPGDPVTLTDGTRVKLTQVNRGYNGVIECRAVADNPADLTASVATPGKSVDEASIIAASTPRLQIIDSNLLRDIDNDHPGPYLAAYTYGDDDPGISFLASADNSAFSTVGAIGTEPIFGTCDTVPSSVDWENWDTTNTIRVRLKESGTLSTVTDAEILAGANAAVWGREGRWEVVQWKTASLVSTDVYDLSNLLRGRRGTNTVIDSHSADDWFIVVGTQTTVRHGLQNADIGTERYYKVTRSGQAIADVVSSDWTVGNNPLRPYSPISPSGTENAGDVDMTWTRRTRKGGAYGGTNSLTDGVGGPISEDSESYSVETYDASDALITTRTSTSTSYTLTAANITSDYGAGANYVKWKIRQNSAVSGVIGYPTPMQTTLLVDSPDTVLGTLTPDRYYKLNETSGTTADDSSTNNSDGTYVGAVDLDQDPLTIDFYRSFLFTGGNEHVTYTSSIANGASTFSLSFYFVRTSTNQDNRLWQHGSESRLRINGSDNLEFRFYTAAATFTDVTTTGNDITTDQIHHIAVTFGDESGNNWLRIFINGADKGNNNFASSTLYCAGTTAIIGSQTGNTMDGRIGQFAEWNATKLTGTNVSDLAAGALT